MTNRWRVGQHYGIHVYEGDRPVATFHRDQDASAAVNAVNAAAAALPADPDHLRAALTRAQALHRPIQRWYGSMPATDRIECTTCRDAAGDWVYWPCPTGKALTIEL